MLGLLYAYVVTSDRILTRTARELVCRTERQGMSHASLRPLVPTLEWRRARFWSAHLVIGLALVWLVAFNPQAAPSFVLLGLAVVGWVGWTMLGGHGETRDA
jgi:hypothetical protein